MRGRVKLGIEFKISCSDTMLNYWLSQKVKLLENGEFNHLTISLTKNFHSVWDFSNKMVIPYIGLWRFMHLINY